MEKLQPADAVTIFTPDDTHFNIALEAIRRGLHVVNIIKMCDSTLPCNFCLSSFFSLL